MRNGRIAICLLAIATLACQFLTKSLEAPTTQLPATAAPANPSYAPTGQTSTSKALLSQNGPWIVFSESDGLYAANMDGSMATKVFDLTPFNDLSSIAPTGGRFAIMTANEIKGRHGLTLHIFHLPDGKEEKTIPLTGPQSEPPPNVIQDDPRLFPLRYFGTSQWSPDGSQLAFDAGIDGDNSDLYLYSTADGRVTRLTTGSAQGEGPSWSPDGKYIVHFGIDGTTGKPIGVWATLVSNGSTSKLYTPDSDGENVLGWLDGQTVVVYSFYADCSRAWQNIRAVNVNTQKVTMLWGRPFNDNIITFDPASGAFVLEVDSFASNAACPQNSPSPGTYLVPRGGKATKISDSTSGFPIWSPEAGAFFYPSGNGFAARRPDGTALKTPPELNNSPGVSPDGKAYLWQNAQGGTDLFFNGSSQTLNNVWAETLTSYTLNPTGLAPQIPVLWIWNQDSNGFVFASGTQLSTELYIAQAADNFSPVALATMGHGNPEDLLFRVSP